MSKQPNKRTRQALQRRVPVLSYWWGSSSTTNGSISDRLSFKTLGDRQQTTCRTVPAVPSSVRPSFSERCPNGQFCRVREVSF
ncbi:MAG: hypothetical protein ACXAEU_05715 [Candidatus Hodarchaeales archaeon]